MPRAFLVKKPCVSTCKRNWSELPDEERGEIYVPGERPQPSPAQSTPGSVPGPARGTPTARGGAGSTGTHNSAAARRAPGAPDSRASAPLAPRPAEAGGGKPKGLAGPREEVPRGSGSRAAAHRIASGLTGRVTAPPATLHSRTINPERRDFYMGRD